MSKLPQRGQKVDRAKRIEQYEEFSGAKAVARSMGNVEIKYPVAVEDAIARRQVDEATMQIKAIKQALTFSVQNILCATKDERVYELVNAQLTPEEREHVHFINFE